MSVSLKDLGIDRLSLDERCQLLDEMWVSIASELEESDIPQSHKDLLERRLAAYEADPTAGSSWEEVRDRLRQRRQRRGVSS